MARHRLGIVVHGVRERMGTHQHLVRSILAIRERGGVMLKNGDHVLPDPILVGRNEAKISALAHAHGVARVATNLDAALADATTPCSSMRRPRACVRHCSPRRSMPASTFIAKSHSPPACKRRLS